MVQLFCENNYSLLTINHFQENFHDRCLGIIHLFKIFQKTSISHFHEYMRVGNVSFWKTLRTY